MKKQKSNSIKHLISETDLLLYITCILTSAFGALMVFSATKNDAAAAGLSMSRDCLIMILASVLGIAACLFISFLDYNAVTSLWMFAGGICLVLLLLLFPFGEAPADRPDAICWLPIIKTGSLTVKFQPSELAKVGFIITFTAHLDKVKDDINSIKNVILLTLHGLVPMGLVIITGDLGSALVFGFMFIGMMFMAGLKLRYFAIAIGSVVAVSPLLWTKFLGSLHRQRILAIYYPDALSETALKNILYQQQRCVNAIGSGRFLGDGLFKGTYTQSAAGVPVNESDTVFSVVGEELGFLGAVCLLGVLAFIIIRIMFIGRKSRNFAGSIICFGTAFMIGSQVIMNIGMCLMLLPCVGITLPFVSAGGSSNLCIFFAIGLVMSVYRFNKDREMFNYRLINYSTPFAE